jgi:S-adenosylmethionine-diacylgycerolhomoserine-N-methlytransferase
MTDIQIAHETAHADRMDRMYRYQRHIYDITRKYYLLGRDQTILDMDVKSGQSVLELGCGTGRNLALVARHFPGARLFGLDISAEMLVSAEANFQNSDHPRPVFKVGDATDFKPQLFGEVEFDRILISYALSMIPDWEKSVKAALSCLAPGGSLHIVDFGQQENLPSWFGSLLRGWLARFHVTPRPDLKTVLESAAKQHEARLKFISVGRGYAWRAIISA